VSPHGTTVAPPGSAAASVAVVKVRLEERAAQERVPLDHQHRAGAHDERDEVHERNGRCSQSGGSSTVLSQTDSPTPP
jgi:hypothetical protein